MLFSKSKLELHKSVFEVRRLKEEHFFTNQK